MAMHESKLVMLIAHPCTLHCDVMLNTQHSPSFMEVLHGLLLLFSYCKAVKECRNKIFHFNSYYFLLSGDRLSVADLGLYSAVKQLKLEKELGLKDLGRNVGWAVKSCCAVTGEGLEEAFSSLQELIVKKRRTGSRPPSASKGRLNKKVQRSHSHHF